MTRRTYGELFQDLLEERISSGGDVGNIVTLVNAYQNHDPTARQFAFSDWLDAESFTCTAYGKFFKVTGNQVEEEQYVLCPKCRRMN